MGLDANVVTYNSVINACARCSNGPRAEFWFQKMIDAGVQPALFTFNSLINAFVKAGDQSVT